MTARDDYSAQSHVAAWKRRTPGSLMTPAQRRRRGVESPFFRSKFRIPNDPRHFVPRPRLLALLDDLAEYPVTAIVAPAGAREDRPRRGLATPRPPTMRLARPGRADRDPAQFWRSVTAVLEPLLAGPLAPLDQVPLTQSPTGVAHRGPGRPRSRRRRYDGDPGDRRPRPSGRGRARLRRAGVTRPRPSPGPAPSAAEPTPTAAAGGAAARRRRARGHPLRRSSASRPTRPTRLLTSLCPDITAARPAGRRERAGGWTAALQADRAVHPVGALGPAPSRSQQAAGPDQLIDEYLWQEVLRGERPELIRMLLATAVVGGSTTGSRRSSRGALMQETCSRRPRIAGSSSPAWTTVAGSRCTAWSATCCSRSTRDAGRWDCVSSTRGPLVGSRAWTTTWLRSTTGARRRDPTDVLRVLAERPSVWSTPDSARWSPASSTSIPPGVAGSGPDALVRTRGAP